MRIKKLKPGFEKLTKEKARLIAHLIGDGYIGKSKHDYNIKYEVSDKESLDSFRNDLVKVYGLEPTMGTNPSGKTGKPIPFVRLRSKLAYDDLSKYARFYSADWFLKDYFLCSGPQIKKEFLRALFDDEGSVVPTGKTGVIKLYSINDKGLVQVKIILDDFGIETKMLSGFGQRRNVYALLIKDLKSFNKKIGFNLTRKQKKLNSLIK